jgi:hypothetical protein
VLLAEGSRQQGRNPWAGESVPPPHLSPRPMFTRSQLTLAQGAFYAVTGIWPILHMRSFEAVTGPKADRWLVKTVGGLLTVAGVAMWQAGRSRRVTPEIVTVAAGSAAVLTAIDVVYVSKGRISPVYLLDAVAEVGLIGGWAVAEPDAEG